MRESDVEAHLIESVRAMGGEVRKVKWIGRRGAPDRFVMLPASPAQPRRCLWVELKAPGAKPEPHQRREHERMRAMGERVEVVDSYERVAEVLA